MLDSANVVGTVHVSGETDIWLFGVWRGLAGLASMISPTPDRDLFAAPIARIGGVHGIGSMASPIGAIYNILFAPFVPGVGRSCG